MSKQRTLEVGELILKTLKEKKKSDSLEGKCKKNMGWFETFAQNCKNKS